MSVLTQWLLLYVAPSLIVFCSQQWKDTTRQRRLVVVLGNFFVACSVVLMSLAGVQITFHASVFSVVLFALAAVFSVVLLRWLGGAYILSAVLQQWCLLLSATLLMSEYPILLAACATALPFVWAHRFNEKTWSWRVGLWLLLFVWALCSVYLYVWIQDPLLNTALHLGLGTVFIHRGILMEYRHNSSVR